MDYPIKSGNDGKGVSGHDGKVGSGNDGVNSVGSCRERGCLGG